MVMQVDRSRARYKLGLCGGFIKVCIEHHNGPLPLGIERRQARSVKQQDSRLSWRSNGLRRFRRSAP
jgi:hypothetical protein